MNSFFGLLAYETPEYNTFEIFGFSIYYYAICMVLAIGVATVLTMLLMHRKNISSDIVLVGFVICVPCAIIGARIYSCLSEEGTLVNFFNFRNGGMSVMGSIIGGVGAAAVYCFIKKWNFLRLADCVMATFPLAQAIGRWGNYFNQEVYGGVVENPALQFFPMSVYITDAGMNGAGGLINEWHYAFFFYESAINFVWFFALFLFAWNFLKKPNGLVTGAFAVFYGVVRAVMEPLRDATFQYGNGVKFDPSLFSAYALIVIGVAIIIYALVNNRLKEGKWIGSAEGDPYTVSKFLPSEKGELPKYTSINAATKLKKQGKLKEEWL